MQIVSINPDKITFMNEEDLLNNGVDVIVESSDKKEPHRYIYLGFIQQKEPDGKYFIWRSDRFDNPDDNVNLEFDTYKESKEYFKDCLKKTCYTVIKIQTVGDWYAMFRIILDEYGHAKEPLYINKYTGTTLKEFFDIDVEMWNEKI